MNKAGKAVVAASAGGLLLLGGGGTLAYWGDADTVAGGGFASGQLRLVTNEGANAGCGAWMLDDAAGPAAVYAAGDKIVPGDVLTRDCAFTVKAEGEHLKATVDIGDANFAPGGVSAFNGMLTPAVGDLEIDGEPVTELTEAHDEKTLTVNVTVTFNSAADNLTQDLSTVLDNLTITTTQVHP